ncbi:MAG: hypothetical protein KKH01_01655, partial [Firmicutes bacterium]|nr:hypothetical protein [Bacillota bacterium]
MNKITGRKKSIVIRLLLILLISNFSISFAYWASNIAGDQSNSNSSVQIGSWDFEDIAYIVATFRSDHADVLALTTQTVTVSDKSAVEAALTAYGALSVDAQAELSV